MPDNIKWFDYHHIVVNDDPPRAANLVKALTEAGVDLMAITEKQAGGGRLHLDLIAKSADDVQPILDRLGLTLSERKSGFLVRGKRRPGVPDEVLTRLADAHIGVSAVQPIAAGAGRRGTLLWVKPADMQRAAMVLRASAPQPPPAYDIVDEASEESFPASDAPSWAMNPRA